MSNFLDKVGLQHFVEKIKSLLKGYLPLSGGTMTGAINKSTTDDSNYTSVQTTIDNGFKYYLEKIYGDTTSYIDISKEITIDSQGINMTTNKAPDEYSGELEDTHASFNTDECKTKKFTLSTDSNAGLIANNSETVVKELTEEQIINVVLNNAPLDTKKYYMSGDNFSNLIIALKYNDICITIATTENASFTRYTSGSTFTIPANTNYIMSKDLYRPTTEEDTKKVKSILYKGPLLMTFTDYINLKIFDGSAAYLDSLDDLSNFFSNCTSLTSVKINNWNTNEVTSLQRMFNNCNSLKTLDLSNWDTRNVTDTSGMFNGCRLLTTLDLSGWNMQNVENMNDMFKGCSAITELTLDEGFGRMKDSVGTVDFSMMTKWVEDPTFNSLIKLYDRASNNMGVITLKLPSNTVISPSIGQALMTKGYTVVK